MENKEDIIADIKKVAEIELLAESAGGRRLIAGLQLDILNSLEGMVTNRATYTLQEYITAASDIKSKLDVMKALNNAKSNKEVLEGILKEME